MTDWIPGDPDPTRPAREPRRCRQHEWVRVHAVDDAPGNLWHLDQPHTGAEVAGCHPAYICVRCFKVRDEAASRRGRNNRKRGLTIQRESVRAAGGENIPGNGPYDGRASMFRFESKSGGAFPERLWKYLRGIPVTTETPVLIVSDTPGPGHKRRAVVVLDLDHWRALHGGTE